MKKLVVLIGFPGSGKSTWRKKFLEEQQDKQWGTFSLDDIRMETYQTETNNLGSNNAKAAFDYVNTKRGKEQFDTNVKAAKHVMASTGSSYIVDNVNVSPKRRAEWRHFASQHGFQIEFVVFTMPFNECLKIQEERGDKAVPAKSMFDMREQWDLSDLEFMDVNVKVVNDDWRYGSSRTWPLYLTYKAGSDFDVREPMQVKWWLENHPDLVTIKSYTEGQFAGLRCIKYSRKCMYDNLWDYAAIQMRGLVIDESYEIVAWPLTKMGYIGEKLGIVQYPDLKDKDEVVPHKKLNGFMIAVTKTERYGLIISTTGSLDSSYVELAKECLIESYGDQFQDDLKLGHTYLYEGCHPKDPHVVPEYFGAHLLGVRHPNGSWRPDDLFLSNAVTYAKLKEMEKTELGEGWVLYVLNSDLGLQQLQCKSKTRFYSIVKLLGRAKKENLNRLIGNTEQLCSKFGHDLHPFFSILKENIEDWAHQEEQAKMATLRELLESTYRFNKEV